MPDRPTSMEDVARKVGLSRTTVSFVLSGRIDIHIPEETRQRVWEAVRELDYRPNATAQSLASSRTNLIGLITDIPTSPFGGGIIHGAQEAAWQHRKLLLIVSSEGDPAIEAAAFDMLLQRRVEGVIYATFSHHEVTLPRLALEVPTVLVHCFDPEGRFPSVLPDEAAGGYTATRRLLDAGHRRIALINLAADLPAAVGRLAGYQRALTEAGLGVDPQLIASGDATAASGFDRASQLLDLTDRPTSFFCGNDRMAMGAYDAIKERGFRIPGEIAVVGYDNQEIIAAFLRPPLTTVTLPFDAMGSAAVGLLGSISQGAAPVGQTVTGVLVERSSV